MFDRHALHADAFAERMDKIDRPAAQRAGDRVLVILRHVERDANAASVHQVGHALIAYWLYVAHAITISDFRRDGDGFQMVVEDTR